MLIFLSFFIDIILLTKKNGKNITFILVIQILPRIIQVYEIFNEMNDKIFNR